MSLILMIFYWLVMPISLVVSACWLFRHTSGPFGKSFVIVAAIGLLSWFFWEAAGKKMYWDAKVRELCAKDGGIRVYETVELPAERFNKWGQPNFYRPDQGENALGSEYLFQREIVILRKDNPEVFRMQTRVFRRFDEKLLGESVFFKRAGGDLPGPWYGSSNLCPEVSVANDVLRQIFIKE